MQRLIVIILGLFLLVGCKLLPDPVIVEKPVYIEKPLIHPPFPEPFVFEYKAPHVITKETIQDDPDNIVYQGFEWDDGQDLVIQLQKWRDYTRKLTAVVCSYRRDLKEEICKQYLPKESDE